MNYNRQQNILKRLIETVKINEIYHPVILKFERFVYYNSSGEFKKRIIKGGLLKKVV